MTVRLQILRHEFETTQMNAAETVQEFVARMQAMINHMRILGDTISDGTVVAKLLRSLTLRFDSIVTAIEEAWDLSNSLLMSLAGRFKHLKPG